MNWLPEEEFKGFSTDFFKDFIDTIEIPTEDFDTANVEADWEAKFRELEPPPMDMFTSLSSEFTSRGVSKGGRVGAQKTVPVVKQSSSSDALSGVNSALSQSSSAPDIKVSKLFQSLSPVSVLENSDGSYSPLNTRFLKLTFPVKGLRSKRKRPTTQRLRLLFPFEVMKSAEKLIPGESGYQSYYSSEQHAKKKRKNQPITHSLSSSSEVINSDGVVRKCTHCETTKTPQWREGPSGPKTLCNACGVRYRSGRLVPEYRPASSPTFIPSVHSNSHRKIVEMRRKEGDRFDTSMIHAVTSGGA